MAADMMARTLYLPADTTINLTAAKTVASQLAQQATVEDLRTLLEHGWIIDDTLAHPDSRGGDELAARIMRLFSGGLESPEDIRRVLDASPIPLMNEKTAA